MVQSRRSRVPWWLRAYLLIGAAQGLAIGLTGLFTPSHVIGFPLSTTPLNVRFVACFYIAGAVGLIASALSRWAIDTRIYVVGFITVTTLLLAATLVYWSTFTAGGVPYPWLASYTIEPLVGIAALQSLNLWRAAQPGRHRFSAVFITESAVFAVVGLVLAASPHLAIRLWPWTLTPVLARTYSAIFLAFALGAWLAATERRSEAVRAFALSSLVLVATTAVISIVHHARFDAGPATWVWVAGLVAGLIGLGAATTATMPRPR